MRRINARSKGASGERELARWLKDNLRLNDLPQRNLEQVRSGGSDIIDVYPFFFECKRVENLDLLSWWIQVKHETKKSGAIPVVAFRQNHKTWEFLISAEYIGIELGFLRLDDRLFIKWAINKMSNYQNLSMVE